MCKTLSSITLLAVIIMFQSCTTLRSPHYVGVIRDPMKLDKNLEQKSVWQFDEEIYHTRIIDSTDIVVSSVKWKPQENNFVTESSSMLITSLDNNYFMNVRDARDSLYSIYRISGTIPENGTIAFLTMNKDSLDKIINETDIQVSKDEASYVLDLSKQDLDLFIQTHINRIFPFSSVGIIRNLQGYKKKQMIHK